MIGREITAAAPTRRSAIIAIVLATLIGVPAFMSPNLDLKLAALLPLSIGIAALIPWNRGFRIAMAADGMRDLRGRLVPYSSIREVRAVAPLAAARPLEFPIEVVHAGGLLVFPARLNERSERVYAFLRTQIASRQPLLPPLLASFASEQRQIFGPEKVLAWATRQSTRGFRRPRTFFSWIGTGFAGLLWLAGGIIRPSIGTHWIGFGVLALMIAAIVLLADMSSSNPAAAAIKTPGGLVVSPAAIAMQLGDLKGKMTWEEIIAIVYPIGSGCFAVTRVPPAIAVEVDGARILILDAFTHSLDDIHAGMKRYWRPSA